MPSTEPEDPDSSLPPPGSRSGVGAQSVLPYLTKSLQAKPAAAPEARPEMRPHGNEAAFPPARPPATH